MRTALLLATLALLAAAPTALAQNGTACPDGYVDNGDGTCSQQAWVDDCPPDMMCAANESGEPIPYGNESCIECSGPAPRDPAPGGVANGGTCMDGQQGNETCDPDVYYLGGEPTRGPADGSCENCRGEEAGPVSTETDAKSEVPGLEAALVFVAIAGAVFLALRRK